MMQRPPIPDTAAIVTGLAAAIIAETFSEANVLLAILWGFAVVIDFLAGVTKTLRVEGWGGLRWSKFGVGVLKRIAAFCYVLLAALVDAVAIVMPALGPTVSSWSPATKTVLVLLIGWEGVSIVKNAREGSGFAIPFSTIVRNVDRLRFGGEPPRRRHYDDDVTLIPQEPEDS